MWVEENGGPLDSLVWLPEGYTPEQGHPVVVLLHGFGSNREDLTHLAETIASSGYVHIVPNGPLEAFPGVDPAARAWYQRGGNESPEAVVLARGRLGGLIDGVQAKYAPPAGRMVLIGFSQGGNLAMRYGLAAPEIFAGVASLAGSLSRFDEVTPELPARRDQRLFIAHGYRDMVVPFQVGRNLVDALQRNGYRPEFRAYTIGHMLNTPLVDDLRRWLLATVAPVEAGESGQ